MSAPRIDPRRAKVHHSYTVAEAARLFGVHRNTVRAWIRQGLETMRSGRTVLIHGQLLRSFLEKRRTARRSTTPAGQLYCFRCRAARPPAEDLAELVDVRGGSGNVRAICACGSLMHRRVSLANLETSGFGRFASAGSVAHSR